MGNNIGFRTNLLGLYVNLGIWGVLIGSDTIQEVKRPGVIAACGRHAWFVLGFQKALSQDVGTHEKRALKLHVIDLTFAGNIAMLMLGVLTTVFTMSVL
eukprot:2471545-Amphidinium_carterae.1